MSGILKGDGGRGRRERGGRERERGDEESGEVCVCVCVCVWYKKKCESGYTCLQALKMLRYAF